MSITKDGGGDIVSIDGMAAFALAAQLSREQWLLAGNQLPSYSRAEMPVVFIPSGS